VKYFDENLEINDPLKFEGVLAVINMDILETVINFTYIKWFPVKNVPKQKVPYSKNSLKNKVG
jgi:hypothetical protein